MRGSGARALLPALAVLGLVGVVAIAATGTTPGGTGDARPPADTLLDTMLSLGLLLLIPAAAIFVWALFQREAIAREIASGRYRRRSLVSYLVIFGAYGALGYYAIVVRRRPVAQEGETGERAFPVERPREVIPPRETTQYEPEFALVPSLVVLAIVAVGLGAALLSLRRRTQAEREVALAEALADVLSDTLDDLRAEADPRRAVIAAYARLERALAAHGLPRRAAETPEEYLARILGDLEVGERSVRRLTDLFEEAKFSDHTVSTQMKEEAIDALEQVRDELRSPPEPRPEAATPATVSS